MKIRAILTVLSLAAIPAVLWVKPAVQAQQDTPPAAETASDTGGFRRPGRLLAMRGMFNRLKLTDEQRKAGLAVIRTHRPAIKPLTQNLVKERFALRALFKAPTVDEAAIRAQSARVAAAAADVAVQRAYLVHDLRAIATPEQLRTLDQMQAENESRITDAMDRADQWIATH